MLYKSVCESFFEQLSFNQFRAYLSVVFDVKQKIEKAKKKLNKQVGVMNRLDYTERVERQKKLPVQQKAIPAENLSKKYQLKEALFSWEKVTDLFKRPLKSFNIFIGFLSSKKQPVS